MDNDPLVLAHARALLTSAPEGRTTYIEADLREPGKILASPVVRDVPDFSQPVALMLVAVLHFFTDEDRPGEIVRTLLGALSPGSYLVASVLTPEHDPEGIHGVGETYRKDGVTVRSRTADELGRLFFSDLELVPPGVVLLPDWRSATTSQRPMRYLRVVATSRHARWLIRPTSLPGCHDRSAWNRWLRRIDGRSRGMGGRTSWADRDGSDLERKEIFRWLRS